MSSENNDARIEIAQHWLQRLQPLTVVPVQIEARPPHTYEAVLFDIYGTLLTSQVTTADAQASAIADICVDVFPDITPPALHHCHAIRNSFHQQLKHNLETLQARGQKPTEVDFRNIWAQVLQKELSLGRAKHLQQVELFAFLYAIVTHRVWPQPDLLKTIKGLAERKIPLGVISNAQFYTPIIVSYFLDCKLSFKTAIIPWFEQRLTFYSFQHGYAKPDDYFFVEAKQQLTEMGIDPAQTLYVGNDYRNDIDSANRNGLLSVLYAGDKSTCRMNHPTAEPDFVVTNLEQLL